MANIESKLKTENGDVVVVKEDSLPSADLLKKGIVKQADGVAVKQEWGREDTKQGNDIVKNLRASGVLAHNKFALIYDPNDNGDYADHAVFDENTYTTGQTATIQFEAEKGDIPRRDGYEFLGWAISPSAVTPDFSYELYEGGQEFTVTFANNDIVLYAVWQLRTCTLTYALGDYGTGSVPSPQTVAEGSDVEVSGSPAPTVNDGSGRVFVGWSTSDGGYEAQDVSYSVGDTIYLYSDTTLYPVFVAVYTLTYALGNDATGTVPSAQTAYNGQTIAINFNPSVTCISDNTKVFAGWSTSDESSYADYTSDGTNEIYMNYDVTLYPVFEAQGGGGGGDGLTIDNTNGEYAVVVWHTDENSGDPVTDFTVTAGGSDTFTFTDGVEYGLEYQGGEGVEVASLFTGSYSGTGYNNEELSSDANYGNAIMLAPDGDSVWIFSSGDYGTLVVNQSNS